MKALVIGGNGFIGTNLVDALLEDGNKVRVFDRYPSRFRKQDPRVEYMPGDFANHGEVHQAVEGMDWVFHLAYTTLPQTSNEDPVYDVRSNVIDTVQLLTECRDSKVRKIIFVSSGGTIYGVPLSVPINEQHPTDPICSYGITKLTIEKYLRLFHQLWGLDYVVTRISNPYGELQNPESKQGAVGVFLGNVRAGRPITIWGDGEVIRDYIYIGDAVQAMVKAAGYDAGPNGHRIFNIGAGTGHSLNQLVDTIRAVADRPVSVSYEPARAVDVPANVLDITRARTVLGWSPQTGLADGISRAWNWVRALDSQVEILSPTT